jgi:hypothetical protein
VWYHELGLPRVMEPSANEILRSAFALGEFYSSFQLINKITERKSDLWLFRCQGGFYNQIHGMKLNEYFP